MRIVLVVVIFTLNSVTGSIAQQNQDLAVYVSIETFMSKLYEDQLKSGTLKELYDKHVAEFKEEIKKYPRAKITGNWADAIDNANDWMKMWYYNIASITAACAAELNLDATVIVGDSAEQKTRFQPCYYARYREMVTFFKTDNLYIAFSSGDKFASECEPAARQRDREQLLRPYGFLKTKDGTALRLLDFGAYNKCMRAKIGR